MEISYSKATDGDAYGINYVSAYTWKETYANLLPEEYLNNKIKNFPNKIEKTKDFLKIYNGEYIVAKDKEKIVGILSFCPSKDEKYKEYGHLDAIYVLKEYHGLGIGRELFKRAVEGLIKMGYSKMYLECMAFNNTLNFYKKYDGVVQKQIDYFLKNVGSVKVDIVLFEDLNKIMKYFDSTEDEHYKKIGRS